MDTLPPHLNLQTGNNPPGPLGTHPKWMAGDDLKSMDLRMEQEPPELSILPSAGVLSTRLELQLHRALLKGLPCVFSSESLAKVFLIRRHSKLFPESPPVSPTNGFWLVPSRHTESQHAPTAAEGNRHIRLSE